MEVLPCLVITNSEAPKMTLFIKIINGLHGHFVRCGSVRSDVAKENLILAMASLFSRP